MDGQLRRTDRAVAPGPDDPHSWPRVGSDESLPPSSVDPGDLDLHPPDDREGPRTGPTDAADGRRRGSAEEPVLPALTSDERDVGWGGDEWRDDGDRNAWYEQERAPHHEA